MLEELNTSLAMIIYHTKTNLSVLLMILASVWLVFFLNALSHYRLNYLGIIPRHLIGLPGIFFAPFLHANFNHLFFNSIPLFVLSNFLLINSMPYFLWASFIIAFVSGVLTWLLGKPGIHIGASGIITGYWALLVSNIFQQGGITTIILGLISLYYFAGIFLGIFPSKKGVSWEGHLFGLLAGLITSYLFDLNLLKSKIY